MGNDNLRAPLDFCEKIKTQLRRGQVRLYPAYAPDGRFNIGDYGILRGGCFFDRIGTAEEQNDWGLSSQQLNFDNFDYQYIQTLNCSSNCQYELDASGSWNVSTVSSKFSSKTFATLYSRDNHQNRLKKSALNSFGIDVWNKMARGELSVEFVFVVGIVESASVRGARGRATGSSFSIGTNGVLNQAVGGAGGSLKAQKSTADLQPYHFQKEPKDVCFLHDREQRNKVLPATPALILASLDKISQEKAYLREEHPVENVFLNLGPHERISFLRKLVLNLKSYFKKQETKQSLLARYAEDSSFHAIIKQVNEEEDYLPEDSDYLMLKWLNYDARLLAETGCELQPKDWAWRILDDGDDSSSLMKIEKLLPVTTYS